MLTSKKRRKVNTERISEASSNEHPSKPSLAVEEWRILDSPTQKSDWLVFTVEARVDEDANDDEGNDGDHLE